MHSELEAVLDLQPAWVASAPSDDMGLRGLFVRDGIAGFVRSQADQIAARSCALVRHPELTRDKARAPTGAPAGQDDPGLGERAHQARLPVRARGAIAQAARPRRSMIEAALQRATHSKAVDTLHLKAAAASLKLLPSASTKTSRRS